MSNIPTEKKTTPWTLRWEQGENQELTTQEQKIKTQNDDWKKLKVLPYIFSALIFVIIFLFGSRFQNLGADLFSSSGEDNTRFGMPVDSTPLEDDAEEASASGTTNLESGAEAETGAVVQVVEDETNPATESTDVITEAQTVEITPVTQTQTQETTTEVSQTVETVEVVPVNTNTVQTATTITTTSTNNSTFRLNTHTYDTVDAVEITDNVEVLTLENLNQATAESVSAEVGTEELHSAATYIQPTQNVQSGPEENLVVLISVLFSGLVWLGMRKIKKL